jgi:hypothetical protein
MVNVSETGFMIAIWRFLGLLVWTPLRSYVGHTYDTPVRPLAPRRSHRRASRGAQVKHLIQRGLKRLRSPDPSEGFFEELAPEERALRYRTPPELGAEIEARIQDSSPSRSSNCRYRVFAPRTAGCGRYRESKNPQWLMSRMSRMSRIPDVRLPVSRDQ